MAAGMGLNMRGYGATDATSGEEDSRPVAKRSRRRASVDSTSGHHTRRRVRPDGSRQRMKASGPRHATDNEATADPSTATVSADSSTSTASRHASRRSTAIAPARTAMAAGMAAAGGSPLSSSAATAAAANSAVVQPCWREGRQRKTSGPQLPDVLDQSGKLGIVRGVASHQPEPELIVLGIQQT